MSFNLQEAINKLRHEKPSNIRVVQMPGQGPSGLYQIEVNVGGWSPFLSGLDKQIAENIVSRATSKVLLG